MAKDADQMTVEELRAKAKSLRAVAFTVMGLAAVYALALLAWWVTGRWSGSQTLGVLPLIALLAAAWPAWTSRRQVLALLHERTGGGS